MNTHVTAPANLDEITFRVVKLIPINMMKFCCAGSMTNFTTSISCFSRELFKPAIAMPKTRRFFSFTSLKEAFSRAKPSFPFFNSLFSSDKRGSTGFTFSRIFFHASIKEAIPRAISSIRMFKPRLMKGKDLSACFAMLAHFFNKKSFISAFLRAKTLLLRTYPSFNLLKVRSTNTTNQFFPLPSKPVLAFSGAKKVFMSLYFVWECLKSFSTHRAECFHGFKDTRRKNINQQQGDFS